MFSHGKLFVNCEIVEREAKHEYCIWDTAEVCYFSVRSGSGFNGLTFRKTIFIAAHKLRGEVDGINQTRKFFNI